MPSSAQVAAVATQKAPVNLGYFECQGLVYPVRRFVLKLRPGERLEAVMVAKGDRIKAGQPLARIVDPSVQTRYLELASRKSEHDALRDEIEAQTLELKLRHAAAQRLSARLAELDKVEQTLSEFPLQKEKEPLIDRKLEIEDAIQTGEARLARLQARYVSQKGLARLLDRDLEAARAAMDNDVIAAPFTGTVVRRVTDPERTLASDIVCEVWDETAFLVEADVLQHQLPYLQHGSAAMIAMDFARSENVTGIVESIEAASLTPDPSGHPKFKVGVRVDKTVPWLRPGMQVAVRVRIEGAK